MWFLSNHIVLDEHVENLSCCKQCGDHVEVNSRKVWMSSVYMSRLFSSVLVALGARSSCFRLNLDAINLTNTTSWLNQTVNLDWTKYMISTQPSFHVMHVSQGHCVGWWLLGVVRCGWTVISKNYHIEDITAQHK